VADVLNDPVRRRSWLLAKAFGDAISRSSVGARAHRRSIYYRGRVEITPTVSPLRSEEVATSHRKLTESHWSCAIRSRWLLRGVSSCWTPRPGAR